MKGWPGETDMEYGKVMADGAAKAADGGPIADVLFDFGNVLVYWNPEPVMTPKYPQELVDRFLDNDVSGFYDASDAMDVGGTKVEAVASVRAKYGDQWADMLSYYFEHFDQSLVGEVPGSQQLIDDLKAAGIGVWGLSNWATELFPPAKRRYPILSSLNDAVVSGYVGLRKPHADIFEHAISKFGVDPKTSLFVDDKSMNVAGANAVGMRALRFNGTDALRQALIEAGVDIPAVQG